MPDDTNDDVAKQNAEAAGATDPNAPAAEAATSDATANAGVDTSTSGLSSQSAGDAQTASTANGDVGKQSASAGESQQGATVAATTAGVGDVGNGETDGANDSVSGATATNSTDVEPGNGATGTFRGPDGAPDTTGFRARLEAIAVRFEIEVLEDTEALIELLSNYRTDMPEIIAGIKKEHGITE